MRGKPIENITIDDIKQLELDGAAEDRRLEFKFDIPVSNEEQKAQRKSSPNSIPIDRGWVHGRSIMDYGRDSLAEEIVAFANADGGTLVLGLNETRDAPPRASNINALPDIAGLERRLKDALFSCIEPRLPYVAVRSIESGSGGDGVVVIEVGKSAFGPHWVRTSRKATVRREDRCAPLSMTEIHDMVLRNIRGRDTAQKQTEIERAKFVRAFAVYLSHKIPPEFGPDVNWWLDQTGCSALGAQVVLTPHYDLGLPRLETLIDLMPSQTAISVQTTGGPKQTEYVAAYTYAPGYEQKILGGILSVQDGNFCKNVKVLRNGAVVVSFKQVRPAENCTCSADLIVGASGFALGVYNRLRQKSTEPSAPADLSIDICTRKLVGVGDYMGINHHGSYGRLEEHVAFPSYTIGDSDDIEVMLNEIAGDLMNTGGMPSAHLPRVSWSDPP